MAFYGITHPTASDPWSLLDRMRRLVEHELPPRQATESALPRFAASGAGNVYPPVNLYETDEDYVVMAELPGVRREDLDLTLEANRITLRGERHAEIPSEGGASVHRRERESGIFRRTFEFPVPVDPDKADAIYRDGVLRVRLPKAASHRPRQIAIQTQ